MMITLKEARQRLEAGAPEWRLCAEIYVPAGSEDGSARIVMSAKQQGRQILIELEPTVMILERDVERFVESLRALEGS